VAIIAGINFDRATNPHPLPHPTDADFGWLRHIPNNNNHKLHIRLFSWNGNMKGI